MAEKKAQGVCDRKRKQRAIPSALFADEAARAVFHYVRTGNRARVERAVRVFVAYVNRRESGAGQAIAAYTKNLTTLYESLCLFCAACKTGDPERLFPCAYLSDLTAFSGCPPTVARNQDRQDAEKPRRPDGPADRESSKKLIFPVIGRKRHATSRLSESTRRALAKSTVADTVIRFQTVGGESPYNFGKIPFRDFQPWFGDAWVDRIAALPVTLTTDSSGTVETVTVALGEGGIGDGARLARPDAGMIERFVRSSVVGDRRDAGFEDGALLGADLCAAVASVLRIAAFDHAGNAVLMEQALPKLAANMTAEAGGDVARVVGSLQRLDRLDAVDGEIRLLDGKRAVIARADVAGIGLL